MTEEKKLLQWHSAFYAGLQIELAEEAEHLVFEQEHTLSTKPMQIDVLIIKKDSGYQIKKNIGRIFKRYNVIEYKSPEDYFSIDDFYKVYGYTCFYKSDTGKTDEIKTEELTITLVCSHYPRIMLKHLIWEKNLLVEKQEEGIYYIKGAMFSIQLLVQAELSEEENLWLKGLTNSIEEYRLAEKLVHKYGEHKNEKLYQSVMDIIVRANKERFKVNGMCDALLELMKDELDAREQKGMLAGISQGINQGISQGISKGITQGITQNKEDLIRKKILKQKSIAQIADELEDTVEGILPIYSRLKDELI